MKRRHDLVRFERRQIHVPTRPALVPPLKSYISEAESLKQVTFEPIDITCSLRPRHHNILKPDILKCGTIPGMARPVGDQRVIPELN